MVCHFLPHLNRDSVWRILKAEGLNRRTLPPSDRSARGQGRFRDYDLGFIHIDIKHLPKLQTVNGERRKRYLYVAIDRRSRSVHLAVKDDETERSAIAFLKEAAAAFPFRFTHVLTDNGSCFTPGFARACAALGAEYRHTKPRSPQTNGMVERFNGRIGSEVLGITVYSHQDLEQLLRGFNAAHNARRQRVLDGKTPNQIVAERLKAKRKLARGKPEGRAGPADIDKARLIAETTKEVSQPDRWRGQRGCSWTDCWATSDARPDGCAPRRRAIPARGASRPSWAAADGTQMGCAMSCGTMSSSTWRPMTRFW